MPKEKYIQKWNACKKCPLHKTVSRHVVMRGTIPADILFIGEAPGKTENKLGKPFIGRAGDILSSAILQLGINSYCITNVVCCIPWLANDPGRNTVRPPSKEEAQACSPHITELVELCNPKVIILLGKEAEKHFPFKKEDFPVPVVPTRHPAYILRKGGKNSLEFKRFLLDLEAVLQLANVPHNSPFQPLEF